MVSHRLFYFLGWLKSVLGRLLSGLPSFLGWAYLLRIPILTGFGFVGVCYLAFTHAKSHMGGAFDINSYVNIFLVSLIAFLFASAVEMAWRLVRCYGPARFFDRDPCTANPGALGSLGYLLLIAIVALPPIGGAIYKSTWLSFSADICKDRFIYGKDHWV